MQESLRAVERLIPPNDLDLDQLAELETAGIQSVHVSDVRHRCIAIQDNV